MNTKKDSLNCTRNHIYPSGDLLKKKTTNKCEAHTYVFQLHVLMKLTMLTDQRPRRCLNAIQTSE